MLDGRASTTREGDIDHDELFAADEDEHSERRVFIVQRRDGSSLKYVIEILHGVPTHGECEMKFHVRTTYQG